MITGRGWVVIWWLHIDVEERLPSGGRGCWAFAAPGSVRVTDPNALSLPPKPSRASVFATAIGKIILNGIAGLLDGHLNMRIRACGSFTSPETRPGLGSRPGPGLVFMALPHI